MQFRFNRQSAVIAFGLLMVEIAIALWVHDSVVRPFIGDVLVIGLLYFLLRSVVCVRHRTLVYGIWLFAIAIEVAQGLGLVSHLGLNDSRLARIVLGTTFDPLDMLAYTLGAALLLLWRR
ncbi:DUF2809 domain-containing protein [Pseudaeromonas sharmana]|uniref:DUF2809 domain-containing protein n=1 Tax=Pseudaeromonas sharmana TaxID=328412 RepID=A0ABV8CPP9_9GAMM